MYVLLFKHVLYNTCMYMYNMYDTRFYILLISYPSMLFASSK